MLSEGQCLEPREPSPLPPPLLALPIPCFGECVALIFYLLPLNIVVTHILHLDILGCIWELLHFEVRLDLGGYGSSHSFLMCDCDAKQAVSWLKALEWSRAMEIDLPLVNALDLLLLQKWMK